MERVPKIRLFGTGESFRQTNKQSSYKVNYIRKDTYQTNNQTQTSWKKTWHSNPIPNSQFSSSYHSQSLQKKNVPFHTNYYQTALKICDNNNLLDNHRYPYLTHTTKDYISRTGSCLCHGKRTQTIGMQPFQRYHINHLKNVNNQLGNQHVPFYQHYNSSNHCDCHNHSSNTPNTRQNIRPTCNISMDRQANQPFSFRQENSFKNTANFALNDQINQSSCNIPAQIESNRANIELYNNQQAKVNTLKSIKLVKSPNSQVTNNLSTKTLTKNLISKVIQQTSPKNIQQTGSKLVQQISPKMVQQISLKKGILLQLKQISNTIGTSRSNYQPSTQQVKTKFQAQRQSILNKKLEQIQSSLPSFPKYIKQISQQQNQTQSKTNNLLEQLKQKASQNVELKRDYLEKLDNIIRDIQYQEEDIPKERWMKQSVDGIANWLRSKGTQVTNIFSNHINIETEQYGIHC